MTALPPERLLQVELTCLRAHGPSLLVALLHVLIVVWRLEVLPCKGGIYRTAMMENPPESVAINLAQIGAPKASRLYKSNCAH